MGIRDTMVDPLLVVRPVLRDCAYHVVSELLWEPDMSNMVDQDGKIDIGLEAELQKRFEHHDPCEMIRELKVIFETHAAVESYEASKQFFGCMMEEGSSVSEHVFAMSGHARKLSDLGIVIPNQLGIHRVLQSLPPSYKNFVMNYNMQNMNKELPELFSMLKSAEVEIQKEHQVLMVNKTTNFKKQGKPKKGNLKKGGKKAAAPPEKPKGGPKPDTDCYYCNGKGHWKRNCPKYLADLKSGLVKKKKGLLERDIFDLFLPEFDKPWWTGPFLIIITAAAFNAAGIAALSGHGFTAAAFITALLGRGFITTAVSAALFGRGSIVFTASTALATASSFTTIIAGAAATFFTDATKSRGSALGKPPRA
ncbi:hypothetical protein QYE76_032653 [Lolium multiflorum]|uniref:CCHC-type domain-containing protein n=1 Tax=Lolium multiflorum TaxID=4521 RepID=A0AAD8QV55_LOLMU|nr:hypothetical protein QYE76_032653 [Lolium multiflorum]